MNPCWCECPALNPASSQALVSPHPFPDASPCSPYRGSLPDMNKMLDKEDFTMMKRAIFATQVWFGLLSRETAIPGSPRTSLPC